MGADQFINTERAVAAGAAVAVLPGELTAATVRAAVAGVLAQPSYGQAAARSDDRSRPCHPPKRSAPCLSPNCALEAAMALPAERRFPRP